MMNGMNYCCTREIEHELDVETISRLFESLDDLDLDEKDSVHFRLEVCPLTENQCVELMDHLNANLKKFMCFEIGKKAVKSSVAIQYDEIAKNCLMCHYISYELEV